MYIDKVKVYRWTETYDEKGNKEAPLEIDSSIYIEGGMMSRELGAFLESLRHDTHAFCGGHVEVTVTIKPEKEIGD